MIKKGVTPKINAVSTVMLAVSLIFVIVSLVFRRGGDEKPVDLAI
jgi:ABC-type spermidine/putrescine transport system permease subunit II